MSELLNEYNITPLDLSQDRFDEIVKKYYTYETYKTSTMDRSIICNFVSNDEGRMCAILEDKEKMILQVVDKDLNIVNLSPADLCNYFINSQIFYKLSHKYNVMLSIELDESFV